MRLFFSCIALFISHVVFGQQFNAFSPIENGNGLSENSIRNIGQLPDGRMYILTEAMINLYDGSTFKYLHLDDESQYPLPGYHGFHHSYVENGRFWVKKRARVMLMDLANERVVADPQRIFATLGINEPLNDFFIDAERSFWFLTVNGKLLYRDSKSDKTVLFLKTVALSNSSGDAIYDIAVLKGAAYLFYSSGLVICFDLASKKERYRQSIFDGQHRKEYLNTLHVVIGNGTLYVVCNGRYGYLFSLDTKHKKWHKIIETEDWVNALAVGKNGNMTLSCRKGLWTIGWGRQKKELITTLRLVDGRSIDTEVSTVFYDRQDGLWVGTLNKGLLYHHADRFRFGNIGRALFPGLNSRELSVTCFAQSDQQTLLVGTQQGLYRYLSDKKTLSLFPGLNKLVCNSFFRDGFGNTWLSTTTGLYVLGKNGIRYFPVGNINAVFNGPDSSFYLCTETEGLLIFDPVSGVTKNVVLKVTERIMPTSVKQMIAWEDKLIGISNAGLFWYDPKVGRLKLISSELRKTLPMFRHSNQEYNCLFSDSRGLLWFGTQDGLNVWDEKRKKLRSFHMENGLVNNSVQAIVEDHNKSLWVSTANGISRIKIGNKENDHTYSFTNYNRYDGVISNEFFRRSGLVTTDGFLFMGGTDGFNALKIDDFAVTSKRLDPVLVSFQVSGREIVPQASYEGYKILEQSISATKVLKLKYSQNFITIGFSALNFVNPSRTFYQYELEGVDHGWQLRHSSDGTGRITYTKLAPGTYLFKVRASDNGVNWNGKIRTLKVIITPPLWLSIPAIVLYIILLVGLVYLIFRWYRKRNEERRIRLQQEKLDELKFDFFTNISHELRTPLTLILTPLEALLKGIEDHQLRKQLQGIYRNASGLLGLVNRMLNFRRLEMDGEIVHYGYCELNGYIANIIQPFEELAAEKKISLHSTCPTDLWLNADKDKLGLILNNLLSNAFKFTAAGGTVTLKVAVAKMPDGDEEAVMISIKDTGCGITEKDLPRIFDRFFQAHNQHGNHTGSGIGLHLVKEYVGLHKGVVKVSSVPGTGSEFIFFLPKNMEVEVVGPTVEIAPGGEKIRPAKILIVEDNDELRAFLSSQLQLYYEVIEARNGREGLQMVLSVMPDLVISDLMMPEMNGLALCLRLKEDLKTSHLPFILLTASFSNEDKGYEVRADAYITKPFDLAILLLRIRNLLEQQQYRKDLFKKAVIIEPALITTTPIDEKLISKALQCIEKNMSNVAYSIEELSSDMYMERSGLYRKLVAVTGQTPSAFLRTVRLKRAAQLLMQREYSIAEIAEQVGFNNSSYFSKCFQEEFGQKPSHYAGQNSTAFTGKSEDNRDKGQ